MGVLFLDRVVLGMKSSNPGAEKIAIRSMASLPRLSTNMSTASERLTSGNRPPKMLTLAQR
jgi:hypothetical protein